MIPLTAHGWREMLIGTILLAGVSVGLGFLWAPLAILPLPVWIWLISFFRDPHREVPADPRAMVSPADGKVSDITEIENCELVGGPAVRVGIFLSVFNVHLNRCPCDGRVLAVNYKKGKFINALHHNDASSQNESNTVILAEPGSDTPVAAVKQIVGLIARRIVCAVSVGQSLARGQRIGMIKFGSRTELYIPKRLEPEIKVKVGDVVHGGLNVIALVKNPIVGTGTNRAAAA
jgi:phosphatidylserine decarboxylase